MSTVLLLRLAGPMQSWGTQSRFSIRDTGQEPSKSGVIGLLCTALGRDRAEPVEDLAALRMAVRVDFEGKMGRDYHTALDVLRASGGLKDCETSQRYYLADADFLVGLQGENPALLLRLDEALGRPVWPLFLGRKAFPPAIPVRVPDGLFESEGLEEVLKNYPWPCPERASPQGTVGSDGLSPPLRFVWEAPPREGEEIRMDNPQGTTFRERRFGLRYLKTTFESVPLREEASCTSPG